MLVRFGKVLVIFALVATIGAHWALLQTVAWTSMIIRYSCHTSLTEAVDMTFDGKHPCCLCKFIQKNRAAEKKRHQDESVPQLSPEIIWQPQVFYFARFHRQGFDYKFQPFLRFDEPLKPPPRNLPAGTLT